MTPSPSVAQPGGRTGRNCEPHRRRRVVQEGGQQHLFVEQRKIRRNIEERPVILGFADRGSAGSHGRRVGRLMAPYGMQILHHVGAAGLEIAQQRHTVADRLEVVDRHIDADGTRHGDQVKHRVGRTAERDDHHMAFSNAARVMMSRGLISSSSSLRIAAPASAHSWSFSGEVAGAEAL